MCEPHALSFDDRKHRKARRHNASRTRRWRIWCASIRWRSALVRRIGRITELKTASLANIFARLAVFNMVMVKLFRSSSFNCASRQYPFLFLPNLFSAFRHHDAVVARAFNGNAFQVVQALTTLVGIRWCLDAAHFAHFIDLLE